MWTGVAADRVTMLIDASCRRASVVVGLRIWLKISLFTYLVKLLHLGVKQLKKAWTGTVMQPLVNISDVIIGQ